MNNELRGVACAILIISGTASAQAATADQPGHESPAAGTNHESVSAVKDAVGGAVGVISAEMTSTAKGFVPEAAVSDMYEIEAGKLAAQRSRDSKVRDFASQMVAAHTKTTNQLKAILSTNQVGASPPQHLDNRRQAMIDNLRGAKDTDFDVRYLSQQVDAHQEALILMRGYAKSGDNPALKLFAAQTQPVVQMHLEMAKALDRSNTDLRSDPK